MRLINKDRIVAEIERRRSKNARNKLNLAASFEDNYLLSFLDTLEVKEVDLDKEIKRFSMSKELYEADSVIKAVAEHFFELGMRINNPITEADRCMAERIIIQLKDIENEYLVDLTEEMEWVKNKAKKGE